LVKTGNLSGQSSVVPAAVRRLSGQFPALGLGYIASVLRQEGVAVSFLDLDVEKDPEQMLREACTRLRPPLVGFSATTLIWPHVARMAGQVHKLLPRTVLICGGPHFTLYPEESLTKSSFDIGVIGEGEETMKELVRAFFDHKPFKNIEGTIIKENGGCRRNAPRSLIRNLDTVPFPARELFPNDRYFCPLTDGKFTTMIASRGCPFSCRYCTQIYWQNIFRCRSPRNIFLEMKACVEEFGFREIMMYDETFTASRKTVLTLCKLICETRLEVRWDIRTRIDTLDEDVLRHLKAAGCRRLHLGIESGSGRILRAMHKKITPEKIKEIMRLVREMGFETLGYFMIGYPGETKRTIEETIRFSRQLGLEWAHFTVVTPAPGIPLYEYAMKNGYLEVDYWQEYTLGKRREEICHFITEEYGERELAAFVRKAYRRFYFHPGRIIARARGLSSYKQFFDHIRGAATLCRNDRDMLQ